MPKKRTTQRKSEAEHSDLQPKAMPGPEQPRKDTPTEIPMMPMPTPMPGPEASSLEDTESPSNETPRVIPMDDYPGGRGGMRMVPMGAGEPPVQSTDRSQASVEGRPPETKMPSA